eukprot:SAG25_NODE_9005_length_392_cov_1.047782_2_plen_44_part_01
MVCSESHYSVLFAPAAAAALPGADEVGSFEVCYYDELGRQEEVS